MGYASELRKQMAQSGFTADQIAGMLGDDDKLDVELDDVEPSSGQPSGKSGSGNSMDVLKALSGKGGTGSGVSIKDISQGIKFSPASEGGSGTATTGQSYSAPAGFDGYAGGSGISQSSTGQGLQMGNAQGISYSPVSDGGTGSATSGGDASGSGGGWASAVAGAVVGYKTASNRRKEYEAKGEKDPYMERAKEDGFGKYHEDNRDLAGGGTLGGVLGYFGGPVGTMVAEPVVDAVHPYGEKLSRFMVNTGEKLTGDSSGSFALDPIATVASGKYKNSDIIKDGLKFALFKGGQKLFN